MRQMYGKTVIWLLFCAGVIAFSAQAQIPQKMLGDDPADVKSLAVIASPEVNNEADESTIEQMQNVDTEEMPKINKLQNTNDTPAGNIIVSPSESQQSDELQQPTLNVNEQEPEVKVEVFEPEFMEALIACRPDRAVRERMELKIIGERDKNCRLKYGNYELNVPKTLLNNIHGFDDLEILVKNKDVAHYKYLPKYVYDGLIYALDSCSRKEEYFGLEEDERLPDASVTRGLNAEYNDNICFIYLQNKLRLDFEDVTEDYGYTCRLPQETVDELLPYFKDIVAKHNEDDIPLDERPKEVHDADIALMYYLQQNDYCAKNNKQQSEGEN